MQAKDVMTNDPACCGPDETAMDAARMMRDSDCGCIPVVDPRSQRTVGVVTDRDLAIRTLADGRNGGTRVRDLMTPDPATCGPDTSIDEVEEIMAERQVRRIPVVDARGACVGIIAQADVALVERGGPVDAARVADVVRRISEPTGSGAARSKGPREVQH